MEHCIVNLPSLVYIFHRVSSTLSIEHDLCDLMVQTAEIHPTAVLGPNVVIGPGVKIGPGVRLQRSVVLSNAVVRDHSWIANSIVGWNSNVGRWVSDTNHQEE